MVSPWKCQYVWKRGYDVAFNLNTCWDSLCTVGWSSIAAHTIEYQDKHENLLTESTVTLNSLRNLLLLGKSCLQVNLLTLCSSCIMSICSFCWFRGQDFGSHYSSSWSLILIIIQSDFFLQICLFIYLISSVFVVLCLESFGASMMYFQSWFLSQVTGNLSRESDCIRLNFKTFFGINLSIPFDIMTLWRMLNIIVSTYECISLVNVFFYYGNTFMVRYNQAKDHISK